MRVAKIKATCIYVPGETFFNDTVLFITNPFKKYLLTSLDYFSKRISIRLLLGNG